MTLEQYILLYNNYILGILAFFPAIYLIRFFIKIFSAILWGRRYIA